MNALFTIGHSVQSVVSRWFATGGHAHDARFRDRLGIQFEGARRFDRHFTISVAPVVASDPEQLSAVLDECAARIRLLDAVTSLDGDVMILWGETDRAGATAAMARLVADGVLPVAGAPEHATFPEDGYTTSALIDAATPDPRGDSDANGDEERVPQRSVSDAPVRKVVVGR